MTWSPSVIWPPTGAPIVLAVLSDRDTADADYNDALIAAAAQITIDALTPSLVGGWSCLLDYPPSATTKG